MKVCYKCKEEKEKREFNKDSTKKDGLNSLCRSCQKQKWKKYHSKNKDLLNKKRRQYRDDNRTLLRERYKDYNKTESAKARSLKYHKKGADNLSDLYVAHQIYKDFLRMGVKISINDISKDEINARRLQLRLHRKIKKLKDGFKAD